MGIGSNESVSFEGSSAGHDDCSLIPRRNEWTATLKVFE